MKATVDTGSKRPSLCPVLIGRGEAVDALRRHIDEVAGGAGRTALIVGEAGIGKSRLAAIAKLAAAERGFAVLEGACFPQDRTEPYAPLAEMLHARFDGHAPEAVVAACGPFARELQPLLPDLLPPAEDAPPVSTSDQERRRLFAALTHCLIDQAGPVPVLLIVEDLHWCDEASLNFLFHAARRAKSRPLLLLGTYRGDEITHHLREWLVQIEREGVVEETALKPLTRDEVGAMAEAILGPRAAAVGLLDALDDLAEGNPFYVEELLTSLVAADAGGDSGDIDESPELHLPRSLRAAVQQRVQRLSPAAQQILRLAAVVGRRFEIGLLLHLTEMDEPELMALLEELVAARLVTEESGERFAFRHALTRQAVYAELLTRARAMLHHRAGEAAEYVYAAALDQHLGDLGEHFFQAEVWDKAQAYARRAGERALRLCAWRAAAEQFTRALEANRRLVRAEGLERSEAALLARTAVAIHRGRGRAYQLLGDFAPAWADHEAVLDLTRVAGDVLEECRGQLDAGVLWASRDHTRGGRYFRRAVELARGLDEPALLVECLNRLGNWHANVAEPWAGAALLRESLAIVERTGCRFGLATTLDWLGTASYLSRDLAGGIGYFERAAALFRELDDRPLLASCLTMLATRGGNYDILSIEADGADVAAAVRDGEEALALARGIDSPAAEAFALVQLAVILGPRGEYGRALKLAERALHVAEAIEHGQWIWAAESALGMLYLDLLMPAQAQAHLERALMLAQKSSLTYWTRQTAGALAIAYLQTHEPERAVAILAEIPSAEGPVRSVGQWWHTYARGRLALAGGDAALALRLCEEISGPHQAVNRMEQTPLLIRLRAEALAALGEVTEAEAGLLLAREAMQRQGTRSELWRIHVSLGDLYRASGRGDKSRREFAAARTIIEEVAATIPDAREREGFLQRATALLPRAYRLSPPAALAARFGGLTARERDVATLIARGRSNREIAAALVLGERTIETHVTNILTKLNAASRREIAVWAADRGLTADAA